MQLGKLKLANLTRNPGTQERKLKIRSGGQTDFQKLLIDYRRCFEGKLFDEKTRRYTWGQRFDPGGNRLSRKLWKPLFIPSIARDMVETHVSYITGEDKFPTITVTSPDQGLFDGLETPEGYEDAAEGQAKAQADALQAWAAAVLRQAKLEEMTHEATQESLILGQCPVLIRTYGTKVWLTSVDRTWCHWSYTEEDPDELEAFTEAYFFTREDEEGKEQEYFFERIIDRDSWTQWEKRVVKGSNGQEMLEESEPTFTNDHGLGFCPVVVFAMPEDQSLFANEVLGNVKGHIEWYNDIKAGIRNNMDPQWVLLKTASGPRPAGRPGDKDKKPLEKQTLWELEGEQLQSFANETGGYEIARKSLGDECSDLRRYSHIIDIPPDNSQSGVALALRLAPQIAAVSRFRNTIGEALRALVTKTLRVAAVAKGLALPEEVRTPSSLKTFTVSLRWGSVMPVTPEVVAQELDNHERMVDKRFMSLHTSQAQILPLAGVDDVEAERIRIQQEKEADDEEQLALLEAAAAASKDDKSKEDEE
ncbi:MAG: hypothetical protein ACAI44_21265 [Candidatus Sericytochromatia bacterium]